MSEVLSREISSKTTKPSAGLRRKLERPTETGREIFRQERGRAEEDIMAEGIVEPTVEPSKSEKASFTGRTP